MKLALAVAFQNEKPWLRLHAPVWMKGPFYLKIALDGGSRDGGGAYLADLGFQVHVRSFDWDFGAHMNCLLGWCRAAGCDAVLRLDPDEVMFPADMAAVRETLLVYKVLRLGRWNFINDRLSYFPYTYPDYQTRAFWLADGIQYSGKVHETLEDSFRQIGWRENGGSGQGEREIVMAPDLAIYHYGELGVGTPRFTLKHANYRLIAAHQPPLTNLPEDFPLDTTPRFGLPFRGAQPLDPHQVGIFAPFGEDSHVRE